MHRSMYAPPALLIKNVRWQEKSVQQHLRDIRSQVFIVEQNVPVELEWDGEDASATHVLVMVEDEQTHTTQAIACARIVDQHKIGRMAVVSDWRGKNVGKALLQHCIAVCKSDNASQVKLSAQTHAVTFYENAGFKVTSPAFLDAGILHVDMALTIE